MYKLSEKGYGQVQWLYRSNDMRSFAREDIQGNPSEFLEMDIKALVYLTGRVRIRQTCKQTDIQQ
jgi:hypothetical protein